MMCEVGTNAKQGEATLVRTTRAVAIRILIAGERQHVGVKDTLMVLQSISSSLCSPAVDGAQVLSWLMRHSHPRDVTSKATQPAKKRPVGRQHLSIFLCNSLVVALPSQ